MLQELSFSEECSSKRKLQKTTKKAPRNSKERSKKQHRTLQETARNLLRNSKALRNRKEYAMKQQRMLHETAKNAPRNSKEGS